MIKNLRIGTLCFAALIAVGMVGCASAPDTADADADAAMAGADTPTQSESIGDRLAFWKWGQGQQTVGGEEGVDYDYEAVAYEDEESKGFFGMKLDGLAFWKKEDAASQEFGAIEEEWASDAEPVGERRLFGLLGPKEPEGPEPITLKDVLKDPAPEMHTLAETKEEAKIRKARMRNLDKRGMRDDVDFIMQNDRASRLSRFPVP